MKLKVYVITLSVVFPVTHPRAGESTLFRQRFKRARICAKCRSTKNTALCMCVRECISLYSKKHTMRANYVLWEARFKEIEAGRACLSIRQWTGKPYASKQVEIARLTKEDGIGLQFCRIYKNTAIIDGHPIDKEVVAWNDGLSLEDWEAWFKNYDKTKSLAVIHFTDYRY